MKAPLYTKTAAALFAAFGLAAAASAADVQIYGVADVGLRAEYNKADGAESTTSLIMQSGQNSGSRFGLRGSEDLGNGLTVGFQLENGYYLDNGEMRYPTGAGDSRLFGREARLWVKGGFGTLNFGRIGGFSSSAGTYDLFCATAESFDGGDGNFGTAFAMSSRHDNSVVYASPNLAGLELFAAYSFQNDGAENAQTTKNKRYAGLAARYSAERFQIVGTAERITKANDGTGTKNTEDATIIGIGGNADMQWTKFFAFAQYAANVDSLAMISAADAFPASSDENRGFKGLSLHLGAVTPAGNGFFTTGLYYVDGESESSIKADVDYWAALARYTYRLSKRTSLYGGIGYAEKELSMAAHAANANAVKTKSAQAYCGITTKF